MDDSTEIRYDVIIGRELLMTLGINIKFSDHII